MVSNTHTHAHALQWCQIHTQIFFLVKQKCSKFLQLFRSETLNRYKTRTLHGLEYALDNGVDYELDFGLDFGLDSRTYKLSLRFQAFYSSAAGPVAQ